MHRRTLLQSLCILAIAAALPVPPPERTYVPPSPSWMDEFHLGDRITFGDNPQAFIVTGVDTSRRVVNLKPYHGWNR